MPGMTVRKRRRYGYQPRWRKQLDGSPNASTNCGVVATGVGIDMQTRGGKHPEPPTVRTRMKEPTGPTDMWDVERAVDSYDTAGELPGDYTKLRGRRETDGDDGGKWQAVLDWLPDGKDRKRNGRAVTLGVDYGKLRRSAPRQTGSESFDGWHGITITAVRVRRLGQVQVRMYDSLNDGRYQGCPGPGAVWVDSDKVREAAFSYGKAVHGKPNRIAGVFLPPGVRPAPEPEPEPEPDPCEVMEDAIVEAIADLQGLLEEHPTLDAAVVADLLDIIEELEDAAPEGNTDHKDDPVEAGARPRKEGNG